MLSKILPASAYGKEHPEYYTYINGERHPGRASQDEVEVY